MPWASGIWHSFLDLHQLPFWAPALRHSHRPRPLQPGSRSGHAGNLREFPLNGNAQSECRNGRRGEKAKQRQLEPVATWAGGNS